jgi:hypothetical protein
MVGVRLADRVEGTAASPDDVVEEHHAEDAAGLGQALRDHEIFGGSWLPTQIGVGVIRGGMSGRTGRRSSILAHPAEPISRASTVRRAELHFRHPRSPTVTPARGG